MVLRGGGAAHRSAPWYLLWLAFGVGGVESGIRCCVGRQAESDVCCKWLSKSRTLAMMRRRRCRLGRRAGGKGGAGTPSPHVARPPLRSDVHVVRRRTCREHPNARVSHESGGFGRRCGSENFIFCLSYLAALDLVFNGKSPN
jgi:hypothetical protein